MAWSVLSDRDVRREGGFTLVELMIVVVLIAVLAAIVIPMFTAESREVTADSEVNAMFTELGVKESAYKLENGTYFSTGTGEADTWPATPSQASQTLYPLPATWVQLKVQPPQSSVKCGYVVIAAGANVAPGGIATGTFAMATPTDAYYYVLAHCDLDGSSTKDGFYIMSSVDSTIHKVNAGF